MNVLIRVARYFRPYLPQVIIATVFSVSVSVLEGGLAVFVKPVFDEVFFGQNVGFLKWIPVILLSLVGLKGIFSYFHTYLLSRVGIRVIVNIRSQLFNHFLKLGQSQFDYTPTGHLMSRVTADVNGLQQTIPAMIQMLRQSFTLLALLAVAIYRDWQLTIVGLSIVPLTGIPVWIIGKKLKKFRRMSLRSMGSLNTIAFEAFGGIQVVKAFNAEAVEIKKFEKENDRYFNIAIRSMLVSLWASPITETISIIGVSAVFVIGGYHAIQGQITPGEFFSFVAAIMLMYRPIRRLSDMVKILQTLLASAERVFESLDEPPAVTEKPDAAELPYFKEKIEFRDVGFRYPKGSFRLLGKDFEVEDLEKRKDTQRDWVLRNISFTMHKGQSLALVGSSGAGKSTVASLMPRFYDVSEGSITIDGMDIRDVTLHSLRSQIALVTQETFLFNESVAENIAYGALEPASREDIIEAAKTANAHDFISAMPQGYDTIIGERGMKLSGGQRQRLAIARAVLRNAPILILDEATSNLDSEAELEVQRALETLMKDRTTLVIAHRLSTIRDADNIVVLEQGRKVEEGTHTELLEKGGTYKRLWEMQYFDEEGELSVG